MNLFHFYAANGRCSPYILAVVYTLTPIVEFVPLTLHIPERSFHFSQVFVLGCLFVRTGLIEDENIAEERIRKAKQRKQRRVYHNTELAYHSLALQINEPHEE